MNTGQWKVRANSFFVNKQFDLNFANTQILIIFDCAGNIMDLNKLNEKITSETQTNHGKKIVVATAAVDAIFTSNVEAPNQEQAADIFKMDIDCFEESLDYLILKDLISLGKTCKRMQQLVAYILHQYYPALIARFMRNHLLKNNNLCFGNPEINANQFGPFICKIRISYDQEFKQFLEFVPKFRRLNEISLSGITTDSIQIEAMKEILSKLKILILRDCEFQHGLHDGLLAYCPNIERLNISSSRSVCDWSTRKYPALKRLEMWHQSIRESGIIPFLKLNPNITKLGIDLGSIWTNRVSLMDSNIQLDELAVQFALNYEKNAMDSMCRLFNELFEHGFYKRLKVYVYRGLFQEIVDSLSTVNGLVKISERSFDMPFKLSGFKNLEEIFIPAIEQIQGLTNVTNLERIYFECGNSNDILTLASKLMKLKKIRLDYIEDEKRRKLKVLDLRALNSARQALPGAVKVTLYVDDEVYLETKWAVKETDFDMIRLKRIASYEWDQDYFF